jgi:hypothetical protein
MRRLSPSLPRLSSAVSAARLLVVVVVDQLRRREPHGGRFAHSGVEDTVRRLALMTAIAVGTAGAASAEEARLQPHTLAGWNAYIAVHDAELAQVGAAGTSFLWLDRQPSADRGRIEQALQAGEVVVERRELRDSGGRAIEVEDGRIHHWVGIVRIPGATLDEVLAFVQDYDRYPERFAPMIPRASVRSRQGDRWTVAMRNRTKKVITVVIDADYVVDFTRLGPTRLESMNVATNIAQVHDAGTPQERRQPGDEADGYLWRFRMVCRFDQRDDGTYEECESVSLTRDIPWLLRPIVGPFVDSVPRETIAFTLGVIRDGVGRP